MPIDVKYLCLGCMNILPHPRAVCPYCGWSRKTSQNSASQIRQESTLTNPTNGNNYLIGKAVGQGGFGIVYVAFDMTNSRKVAIKEYFPTQFVDRIPAGTTVVPKDNNQTNRDFLAKQKRRFYQEAEKMQMFHDSPNVVDVLDYFEANDTAYIVMEFIEGQTFEQVLRRMPDKRLPLNTVLPNLKPIIDVLERIHHTPYTDDKGVQHAGITHRDISPENIMYAVDGTVKLLDFGAARVSEPGYPPTGIIKPGYAPYEQHLTIPGPDSEQGPWTDVYALAATIYRAITGQIPPDAMIRSNTDTLELPSALGIAITPQEEQVLLKGLAIKPKDRYQSVIQFYSDFMKKNTPSLTVSTFTKNGDAYTAFVNYDGDGTLTTSVGVLNGNVLSIMGTNGNFNGVITASEGLKYAATSTQFSFEPESESSLGKKIAWAVAIVALIAAFLMLNKVKAHEIELANIQEQVQTNEEKLEKYRDFAADFGYASASYYADKAIVFVKRNSEAKVSIYCDLLKDDLHAAFGCFDDEGTPLSNVAESSPIVVSWEAAFNDKNRANIIIKAGNMPGYFILNFTNEVNQDSFDVLVVVQ